MAPASLSSGFQSYSDTHNQTGPLWCWFPSGWACAHTRPLWVSPTTSPMRLGVSPAAAPTPTGIFNQRFEALFPRAGALGCAVCFTPRHLSWFICAGMWGHRVLPTALPAPFSATLSPALSVYLCANVGSQGLLVVRLPTLFVPHYASLSPATATRFLSAPPTGMDECLFFLSLVSDFLAVRFSVSSGCARRRSVSTYAAILVLSRLCTFMMVSFDAQKFSTLMKFNLSIFYFVAFIFGVISKKPLHNPRS